MPLIPYQCFLDNRVNLVDDCNEFLFTTRTLSSCRPEMVGVEGTVVAPSMEKEPLRLRLGPLRCLLHKECVSQRADKSFRAVMNLSGHLSNLFRSSPGVVAAS